MICQSCSTGRPPASGSDAPTGPTFRAEPGSLEAFLTERYCLYTVDRRGNVLRGHVHHAPWPLQRAEAEVDAASLLAGLDLDVEPGEPHLLYADRIDVVAWLNERVE